MRSLKKDNRLSQEEFFSLMPWYIGIPLLILLICIPLVIIQLYDYYPGLFSEQRLHSKEIHLLSDLIFHKWNLILGVLLILVGGLVLIWDRQLKEIGKP